MKLTRRNAEAYFSNELPKSGGRSKIREQATDIRQKAILDAALKCFVDRGYLDTTIEHIRTASAASIGSIYHHVADKQVIAATLYLRTLEGAQSAALGLLHRKRTAASGISALIKSYIDWVGENPLQAHFLINSRHLEFTLEIEPAVTALNLAFLESFRQWARPHVAAKTLPRIDDQCFAVLFGPCEYSARRWLSGPRDNSALTKARGRLAAAAYPAILANLKK